MRSPLTETIHRVQGMIIYVRENLSTDEYMLFLDLLVPQPEPEVKPARKARKKSASKKSSRASSLEQQIKGAARGDNDKRGHLGDGPVCTICSHTEDYEDHSQPSPHYHPFQPPAHPVPKVLRQPYSEQEAYGANSETQPEDVSNAVHAGG